MSTVTVQCVVSTETASRIWKLKLNAGLTVTRVVHEAILHYLDDIDKGVITVITLSESGAVVTLPKQNVQAQQAQNQ